MRQNKSNKAKVTQNKHHDIIDVATSISQAQTASIRYTCKYCPDATATLLPYPQARVQHPHAGPSYICPKCGTVYDSSLEKLPRAAKRVTGAIEAAETPPFIETIDERAGVQDRQDEYDKYNPEPNEEEQIKAMGATLIESKIEITDTQGNNRTIVKRNTPKTEAPYY
jgi:RNase P subunit RPR2